MVVHSPLPAGYELFTRYAFPPNELGYCGPDGAAEPAELAFHAPEFDGAWPYLRAIAHAIGAEPLAEDVVAGYWVGGPVLNRVDPADLLADLRTAFAGQVMGLLDDVPVSESVLAHHSFHVFVVYPWIRFLDRNPEPALHWDWVCDTLSPHDVTALTESTLTTLGVVNALREVKEEA